MPSWTIASQQPLADLPYRTNGIFTTPLPSAGAGGPMAHVVPNSEAIVTNILTNNGTQSINDVNHIAPASPGTDAWSSKPLYYGQPTDPIYYVNSCGGNCNAAGTFWHIPNQAVANASGDPFIVIWDQTNDKVLGLYNYAVFPACTATTEAQAQANCSLNFISGTGAQYSDWTTSRDYALVADAEGHAGNSLENKGMSLTIRANEWIAGQINHALYINVHCVSSDLVNVFPAPPGAGLTSCGSRPLFNNSNKTLAPHLGSLIFLDYTDAEIDALALPDWQEPLIRALAHYGGYVGDTSGASEYIGWAIARIEGGEAYEYASSESPLYDWLETQVAPITASAPASLRRWVLPIFNGLPNISSHLHVADPCVPLGMAGQPGGCVDSIPPPASISNIRAVYSQAFASAATSFTISNVTVPVSLNRLMLVFVAVESAVATHITGITFGAQSLARQDGIGSTDGNDAVEVWYLKQPTETTANLVVTTDDARKTVIGVYVLDTVDQTTTFRDVQKSSSDTIGAATSNKLTVTSVVGDLVFSTVTAGSDDVGNGVTGMIPYANQGDGVEQWELSAVTGRRTIGVSITAAITTQQLGSSWSGDGPTTSTNIALSLIPSQATTYEPAPFKGRRFVFMKVKG